jgi:hypothetical protein
MRQATEAHRRFGQSDWEPRHGNVTHIFHGLRDAQPLRPAPGIDHEIRHGHHGVGAHASLAQAVDPDRSR